MKNLFEVKEMRFKEGLVKKNKLQICSFIHRFGLDVKYEETYMTCMEIFCCHIVFNLTLSFFISVVLEAQFNKYFCLDG